MNTPILETTRLLLRPFCLKDAKDVYECWESDPDVAKYMLWTSHNDIGKTIAWVQKEITKIESDDWYRWAFVLKETNELLGTGIIYFEEEYQNFEIAYNLGKKAWGFGYTTEAMNEILRYAKEALGIKEMIGRHAKENPASGNVLKKLGFSYVKDIPYECNGGMNLYEGKEYILNFKY